MKLFIFDMGGVVVDNAAVIPAMAAALGISDAAFFRGAGSDPDATETSPYHLGDLGAFMEGALSTKEFWKNFSGRTGITVSGDPWYDYFNPVPRPDTLAVIAELWTAGFRVVCGTNTLDAHYRKHQDRGDYGCFDAVYASHLMGHIKPHPEFWEYILKEEKVTPEETFFTDDMAENITAAQKLKLRTHLFTGAAGLRSALGTMLS
jgi:putative hydrolase of the HAD superfamily